MLNWKEKAKVRSQGKPGFHYLMNKLYELVVDWEREGGYLVFFPVLLGKDGVFHNPFRLSSDSTEFGLGREDEEFYEIIDGSSDWDTPDHATGRLSLNQIEEIVHHYCLVSNPDVQLFIQRVLAG